MFKSFALFQHYFDSYHLPPLQDYCPPFQLQEKCWNAKERQSCKSYRHDLTESDSEI